MVLNVFFWKYINTNRPPAERDQALGDLTAFTWKMEVLSLSQVRVSISQCVLASEKTRCYFFRTDVQVQPVDGKISFRESVWGNLIRFWIHSKRKG